MIVKTSIYKIVAVSVAGIGKLLAITGETLFNLSSGFKRFNVSDTPTKVLSTFGAISAVYVYSFGSLPSLWTSWDESKEMLKWPKSHAKKAVIIVNSINGIVGGMVVGIFAFVGSRALADKIGLDQDEPYVYAFCTYTATCSLAIYYSYSVINTIRNGGAIVDRLENFYHEKRDFKFSRNLALTATTTVLGSAAISTLSYYYVKTFMQSLNADNSVQIGLSSAIALNTFVTLLFSDIFETYKNIENAAFYRKLNEIPFKRKLLLPTHVIFGLYDTCTTTFSTYNSETALINDFFGEDSANNTVVRGLLLAPAVSAGIMYFNFYVAPLFRLLITNHLFEYNSIEKNQSSNQDISPSEEELLSCHYKRYTTEDNMSSALVTNNISMESPCQQIASSSPDSTSLSILIEKNIFTTKKRNVDSANTLEKTFEFKRNSL